MFKRVPSAQNQSCSRLLQRQAVPIGNTLVGGSYLSLRSFAFWATRVCLDFVLRAFKKSLNSFSSLAVRGLFK